MSSPVDAAVVREQGVEFVVVTVKSHVTSSDSARSAAVHSFRTMFGHHNVVLMTQDHRGTPTYWGRPDIVKFLASVPMQALPWKRYTSRAA